MKKKPSIEIHKLPEAEIELLACLMQLGKATAREIRESMQEYRPMTHGAAVSLLGRLETKELITKEKGPIGKAFVYQATKQSAPIYRQITDKLLNRVFRGSRIHLVASLFESSPPTNDEVTELQKLLRQLKQESNKGKDS